MKGCRNIAKAKGVNLTPRAPKPKKEDKEDKYAEIRNVHKFNVDDKAVFVGLVTKYRGQECIIVKRSVKKDVDYYRVKFEDDEELKDIIVGFLKTQGEYDQWLLKQENGNEVNQEEMSDVERKIIEAGLVPHKNRHSCLNPPFIMDKNCEKCCYESRCIYIKKYQYDKIKG